MGKEYSDYLKFIDDALDLAKKIPKYFSKFSNRIYCNHQKLAIYVLMQKFKTTTRGIVSILRASSEIRLHLGLHRVPVHTTIVRFVNRIKKQINSLLDIRQADVVAVDATGFELGTKSYYYRTVWNRSQKTKRFIKLSVAVDVDQQFIMTYKIRKMSTHDTKDFKELIKNLKCKKILADKGYDSRNNRKLVFLKGAEPHIAFRKISGKDGYYQKKAYKLFKQETYNRRPIIENIFFCIKQKYGSYLRNKSYTTQQVEIISKLIAHNVDKKQHYLLLILKGRTSAVFRNVYKTEMVKVPEMKIPKTFVLEKNLESNVKRLLSEKADRPKHYFKVWLKEITLDQLSELSYLEHKIDHIKIDFEYLKVKHQLLYFPDYYSKDNNALWLSQMSVKLSVSMFEGLNLTLSKVFSAYRMGYQDWSHGIRNYCHVMEFQTILRYNLAEKFKQFFTTHKLTNHKKGVLFDNTKAYVDYNDLTSEDMKYLGAMPKVDWIA